MLGTSATRANHQGRSPMASYPILGVGKFDRLCAAVSNNPNLASAALGLSTSARDRSRRAGLLATGALAAPHNVLLALPLLHPHFRPQPRPLPPQTLVELLKHPFCIGDARRDVLDALAFTYKRPFRDQWEFVAYAQEHQPHLDLLTPPKRTQP
jgi:hypothetical protein